MDIGPLIVFFAFCFTVCPAVAVYLYVEFKKARWDINGENR